MVTFLRRLVILVIGVALLVTPVWVRDGLWHYNARSYTPPAVPTLALAATPLPTTVPTPLDERNRTQSGEFRAGPVLLDLAHYNSINPSSLQPLADALASQGIGLRYWLSKVDALSVTSYLEYPDQSEELANELADASGLIVISPYFLWSPEEIALVEAFVADGGRLLLISDPDISGDYAAATNMIGEPFGVVFNEDYLYDTVHNDGNYTFFFQEAATDDAAGDTPVDAPVDTTPALSTTLPTLANSTIAFYGGRSLSGDLHAVLQSVDTTLSSLRVGRNHFTTAAVAGIAAAGTAGRVLALTDLDVLTEPYRQRYDNQRLVDYVAGFLSADQRAKRVVDFPDYLSKNVDLAFGASAAINADLIMQGAQIQLALETSGRTLTLTDSTRLTNTTSTATSTTGTADTGATSDLIYLADYTIAISQTTILDNLGIELYREVVTQTVPIATTTPIVTPEAEEDAESTATPTVGSTPEATGEADEGAPGPLPTLTPSPSLTITTPFTTTSAVTGTTAPILETVVPVRAQSTPTVQLTQPVTITEEPATATPIATPTATAVVRVEEGADEMKATAAVTTTEAAPISTTVTATATALTTPTVEIRTVITTYLQLSSGLTFLAEETVLIVQQEQADGTTLLAVLAANNRGIDIGVKRLLENDFAGCVIGDPLTFCALEKTGSGSSTATGGKTDSGTTDSDSSSGDSSPGNSTPGDGQTPPRGANAPVLLIDDNSAASPTELSEADLYLQVLIAGGYQVDLWSVSDQDDPTVDDLMAYGWVIWSNGGYANGQIDGTDLETLFSYINNNGRITVSSRVPLPGLEESAEVWDLVSEDAIPALVADLPSSPIELTGADTMAAVLSALSEGDEATQVVLRRGPASEQSDAPALVVLADPSSGDSEARLMIAAFSLAWLPATEQSTLINNMASWMLMP